MISKYSESLMRQTPLVLLTACTTFMPKEMYWLLTAEEATLVCLSSLLLIDSLKVFHSSKHLFSHLGWENIDKMLFNYFNAKSKYKHKKNISEGRRVTHGLRAPPSDPDLSLLETAFSLFYCRLRIKCWLHVICRAGSLIYNTTDG